MLTKPNFLNEPLTTDDLQPGRYVLHQPTTHDPYRPGCIIQVKGEYADVMFVDNLAAHRMYEIAELHPAYVTQEWLFQLGFDFLDLSCVWYHFDLRHSFIVKQCIAVIDGESIPAYVLKSNGSSIILRSVAHLQQLIMDLEGVDLVLVPELHLPRDVTRKLLCADLPITPDEPIDLPG